MQVTDIGHNRRTLIVLAAVCAFLQLALAPSIALGNGHPNFMLILCGCVCLWRGGQAGVAFGFAAGLFFDMTSTGPVGLMAFLMCLGSWLIGYTGRNRLAEGWHVAFGYFCALDGAVCALYSLAMLLLGQANSVLDVLFLRALPTAALTALFFIPFMFILSGRPGGSKGIGRQTPTTFGRQTTPRLDTRGV